MRRGLNLIYNASGAVAAFCIASIVAIVFAQVCLNLIDRIAALTTGKAIGLTIPSYSDFTGYFLAASTFLALAYSLRAGGHIRVTLVTGHLNEKLRRWVEAAVLLIALGLVGFATWYVVLLVVESIEFGDRTSGMVSIPLWIPQLPVAIGLAILTLALADELVGNLMGRPASYDDTDANLLSE
ncbi:MAG: TRAP transporter small permease [Rhodobacteraceae bacterium]|nr:TRAP transporter small permease [Paracoccaceae bacterium]